MVYYEIMNTPAKIRTALCLMGMGLFFQCAYVNTFYNAKVAFNTAYKEHMLFLRTRADTMDVLPDKITADYERAIQKSSKMMDVYPKAKKWHDDAIFLMGEAAYYKKEYDDAIRRMRRLQREFAESPFIPQSYLFMGKAYLENDNLVKAEETFKLILEKYPYLNNREEITLLLAQVAIRREGKAQAIELLEKTLQSVKAVDRKMEIYIKIANLYIDLKQYDRAIELLKKAPRKKDFSNLIYQIDLALLICHIEKGDYTESLRLANRMLQNKKYFRYIDEILVRQGKIFKKQGKINDAIVIFERITKDDAGVKAIRGEAWFELGQIYQHVKGDFEKAKECYQQAISLLSDPELRRIATERVQAIGGLKAMRDAAGAIVKDTAVADSARPVDIARYKLGETFWLCLEEPDSALLYFRRIITDPRADSSMVTRGLFAQAWILRHFKHDTLCADSLFKHIIKRCPHSVFAQKSQKELGQEITILTRSDSAHIAFIDAEKLYFDKSDALAACNAYLKLYKAYPDLPNVAAKSLYAAAWLCDHAMHKKKVSAQKFYTMLCETFPQSDLCTKEAKPRLKIFRDSLAAWDARRKLEPKDSSQSSESMQTSDTVLEESHDLPEELKRSAPETAPAVDTAATSASAPPPAAAANATVQPGPSAAGGQTSTQKPSAGSDVAAPAASAGSAAAQSPAPVNADTAKRVPAPQPTR